MDGEREGVLGGCVRHSSSASASLACASSGGRAGVGDGAGVGSCEQQHSQALVWCRVALPSPLRRPPEAYSRVAALHWPVPW